MMKKSFQKMIIPLVLFILGAAAFWYSGAGEYALVFHQLALLFFYPGLALLLIAVFSLVKPRLEAATGRKRRKIRLRMPRFLKKLAFKMKKAGRKAEVAAAEAEDGDSLSYEAAPREAEPSFEEAEAGLQDIVRDGDSGEKKAGRGKKLIAFELLYVFLQLAAGAAFLWYLYTISLPMTPGYFKYSFLHAALLVIVAGAALAAGKLLSLKNPEGYGKTASGFLRTLGAVLILLALMITLRVLFGFDSTVFLFWVCRIVAAIWVLLVLAGLFSAGLRRGLLEDFGYTILPQKSASGKSFTDILEENTGLSLKSLWSVKFLGRILPGAVLGVAALLLIASCFYVVPPHQHGALYRFGSLDADSVMEPGLHLKLPWPVDKVEYYDTERISTMQIGYQSTGSKDFLWGQGHDGGEHTLILGNGTELVAANIKISYKIDDLYSYLTVSGDPQGILSALAYEFLMNQTASSTLDEFLSVDRYGLSDKMSGYLDELCAQHKLGISVEEAVIESIHPPIEIADVYQNVINASLQKTAMIINAQTEAESALTSARAKSETMVIDAQASGTRRVAAAEYEMAVYYAAFEAYKTSPESFMLNKYLTTFEKIVGGNRVYVFGPGTGDDLSNYMFGASGTQAVVLEPMTGGEQG